MASVVAVRIASPTATCRPTKGEPLTGGSTPRHSSQRLRLPALPDSFRTRFSVTRVWALCAEGATLRQLGFQCCEDVCDYRARMNTQLRGEFFNALNHSNFGVPGVTTERRLRPDRQHVGCADHSIRVEATLLTLVLVRSVTNPSRNSVPLRAGSPSTTRTLSTSLIAPQFFTMNIPSTSIPIRPTQNVLLPT